jgi:GTP-binding protein HflX
MCAYTEETKIKTKDTRKAILYGFIKPGRESDIDEFVFLAESAGVIVLEELAQRPSKPSPRYFINPGSVRELAEVVELIKPDLVIFDTELKGAQRNHLEDDLKVPVLDRTELILDIFALRANTKEGKLQVELAQLMYQLPRLAGMWKHFSALGGGIGTRGPGETQLEIDRRRVNQRISTLKKQLKEVAKSRGTQRKNRMKSDLPKLALVGYTNAGKSTLLNTLTGASAYCDNRLFATLDPLTRKGYLQKSRREFLVTDTVGFIRRIPTQLIAAFKATLEEINFADLLLIVLDVTDDDYREKLEVVRKTLEEIGAGEIPSLVVYNKIDALDEKSKRAMDGELSISALKGVGIDILLDRIAAFFSAR